jgi:hypothetical protein
MTSKEKQNENLYEWISGILGQISNGYPLQRSGVVVITSVLHTEGLRFESGQKHNYPLFIHLFFNFFFEISFYEPIISKNPKNKVTIFRQKPETLKYLVKIR